MLDLHQIATALGGEVSGSQVLAPGPNHSAEDRSLSIKLDGAAPDGFLVHSFAGDDDIACKDFVRGKLGLPPFEAKKANGGAESWQVLREHIYRTQDDAPHTRVRKLRRPDGKLTYAQAHWDGAQWVKGKPKGGKVPYRLPQLIAATETMTVYFCEGEKDADALATLGFVATSATEGASAPWDPALTPYFEHRNVIILPDADKPGRAHGRKVAKALDGTAASVRILDLYPDRNDGVDVSDWVSDDIAGAKLVAFAKRAPLWEPIDDAEHKGGTEEIERLAALDPVAYETARTEAAKRLGMRASVLDKIVAKTRSALGLDSRDEGDKRHGRAITIVDPLPWTDPVSGEMVANSLATAFKTYAVMPDAIADAIALWVLHSWLIEQFTISPRLALTSPTKGCGKSTVLRLLSRLARRPKRTGSISPSALFRAVEMFQPTLLMDENEKFMESGGDLHALLCEGHLAGATVLRVLGDKLELQDAAAAIR